MTTDSAGPIRSELAELIASLSDSQLRTARRFLRFLKEDEDPFVRLHRDASIEDEESLPGEDDGAHLARNEYERGQYVTLEQIESERGSN